MVTSPLVPAIEPLEARIAPAAILVTNILDSGPGSLRQAILDANASQGADSITFSIPTLSSPVIAVKSMLPAITGSVLIDGFANGNTRVTIDGSKAIGESGFNTGSGLMLYGQGSSDSTIRGLAIYGFDIAGIELSGSYRDTIVSNILGLNAAESMVEVRMHEGILISGGADHKIGSGQVGNTIGGCDSGIRVNGGAGGTTIVANRIGIGAGGARPNDVGILIENASKTVIGSAGVGNTISGNQTFGIKLSAGGLYTRIEGNVIGLDSKGANSVGNQEWGIFSDGSNATSIGAGKAGVGGSGNVISGNAAGGIWLKASASPTTISGNLIGTTSSGESVPLAPGTNYASGNGGPGILMFGNPNGTIAITSNVISGNAAAAIEVHGAYGRLNPAITSNVIGASLSGTKALGNGTGIIIDGAENCYIGGPVEQGNTIVANAGDGILIKNSTYVSVLGNYIGYAPNTKGSAGFGNAGHGIHLQGVAYIDIGAAETPTYGNIIAWNTGDGIFFDGSAPNPRAWGPALNIASNFIGTDGVSPMGNLGSGVHIADQRYGFVVIGGGAPNAPRTASGNLISANSGDGIRIERSNLVILGANYVGTSIAGQQDSIAGPLGNHGDGIALIDSINVSVGNSYATGIVSGNMGNGVSVLGLTRAVSNITIGGMVIGGVLDGDGFSGNAQHGIFVDGNVSEIKIGVTRSGGDGDGNIIGANGENGVFLGRDVHDSLIVNNRIGLGADLSSPETLPIASNHGDGIRIMGFANTLFANTVLANEGGGTPIVVAGGHQNQIVDNDFTGTTAAVAVLSGANNLISQNRFTVSEGGMFIDLGGDGVTPNDSLDSDDGANALQNSPLLVSAAVSGGQTLLRGEYRGAANVDVHLEWYVGGEFLTEVDVHTDEQGIARLSLNLDLPLEVGTKFSASATIEANTSEFSTAVASVVPPKVIAKGALPGQAPRVRLLDAENHEVVMSALAFGKGMRGGVNVATGDVDGDGFTDLIATSRTGAPIVKVFSGFDGHMINHFRVGGAHDSSVRSIAAGDLDGDGDIEVVLGRARTIGAQVSVYDGMTGAMEDDFTPFVFNTPDFLRVSLQDVDHDERPEIVVRAEILGGLKQVILDPISGRIERLARALIG